MVNYRRFLPELKSTTLFQNIEDEELIALIEVMGPEIICLEAGTYSMPPIDIDKGMFCVVLKGKPLDQLEPRMDTYNMPKPTEPGMMMGEIPCLSKMSKSRILEIRRKGFPHKRPKNREYDLYLLRMSGEMVTKFYGEQYSRAQGIMLRNFLGILAQKVSDVRQQRADAVAAVAAELAPYRLHVSCATVSLKLVEATAEKWNEAYPELPIIVTSGNSVNLIHNCIDGEACDLLICSDGEIIRSMMLPDYADGYRIWAGNKIVVAGDDIADNWEEKLLAKDATFKHGDPYDDPSGYHAVMAMLLADTYKPGLTARLMNHPGYIGPDESPSLFRDYKQAKYELIYRSDAKALATDFTELPTVMDLSDPALAKEYAKVSFAVDDENTVIATPIGHALTIPKAALHERDAKKFAEMFLAIDKEAEGFLPYHDVVGIDPLN